MPNIPHDLTPEQLTQLANHGTYLIFHLPNHIALELYKIVIECETRAARLLSADQLNPARA